MANFLQRFTRRSRPSIPDKLDSGLSQPLSSLNRLAYRELLAEAQAAVIPPPFHGVSFVDHMRHKKPWSHSVLFSGESLSKALDFTSDLMKRLERGQSETDSYQETFTSLLEELQRKHFPEKIFFEVDFRQHELREAEIQSEGAIAIRARFKEALVKGIPIEFGYASSRLDWSGALREQIHVRRVNLLTFHAWGFKAWHVHGVRSYRFDKVKWVALENHVEQAVGYEPLLQLQFQPEKNGLICRHTFGVLGGDGVLNSTRPEDTNKGSKSVKL